MLHICYGMGVVMDMEQRIFELYGGPDTRPRTIASTIMREFGLTEDEAYQAARKVLRERGTPRTARARKALDEARAIWSLPSLR
jgi:hypothetical protein